MVKREDYNDTKMQKEDTEPGQISQIKKVKNLDWRCIVHCALS